MLELFDKNRQLIPVRIWMSALEELEPGTLEQALNLSMLHFAHHHIAVMPDAHQGYGMPIGGVLAAKGAVIPYAVGLDIGCGMRAAKTRIIARDFSPQRLNQALKQIVKAVPQGFDWHKKPQSDPVFDQLPQEVPILREEAKNARYQLGTLGGGNHFIEFQRDQEGTLWVMIHSGSRNVGKKVAEHFHHRAVKWCREHSEHLPTSELSFFYLDDAQGQEYMQAMNWCLNFARANRKRMMETVLDIIQEPPLELIDIHHNYASLEDHFSAQVMVHRKGATRADKGLTGIVPGSMGTNSYITEGLGNPDSFLSSAHGAGRKIGRHAAKRAIPVDKVLRQMQERGIAISVATKSDLPEECPEAYKDIDQVMREQEDLVKIRTILQPLGVVKG
jgi:tRNA-splicing ligase RtcB